MRVRPRRWSLRARLTAAATLVIIVLLSAAAAGLVWRVDTALQTSTDAAARRQASDLAAASAGSSTPKVPATAGEALVQITDASGRVVASSAAIEGEPPAFSVPVSAPGRAPDARTVAVAAIDDAQYRVVAMATRGSPSYHIYVALPISEAGQSITALTRTLAVGVPLLAATFAGLTWMFAGRALRPVETLRRQADDISLSDLGRRLEVPSTGDELQRLGVTLNSLLERLDGSLNRQRQFVADAAHELRSPVAAIRSQAEVSDHVNRLPSPSALAMESVRLTHLVDDLLALARIDAEPRHRRDRLDLDDIVLAEVSLLRQRTDVAVDVSGVSAAQVIGDAGQLARAVRNVLDNAARYAASRVVVGLRAGRSEAELVIRDDGPGIAAADRHRVLERFTRLDDARARSTGGVGLGLAIVDQVVAVHGGVLRVEDGGPGARIVIRLPLATSTD